MHAQADQNGRFQFEGLVPGKYRLGLFDQLGAVGGGSRTVTLREGQTLAVELKAVAGAR
jgi:hypothetical protein